LARLISGQELAELAPCEPGYVNRLVELGILGAKGGRHAASDVHVVRLMLAFEEAGIALEDVARGVAAGELSFPLGLFLPEPEPAATTYAELASSAGRSPELVRRLASELGLPPPADDRVRPAVPRCQARGHGPAGRRADEDVDEMSPCMSDLAPSLVAS